MKIMEIRLVLTITPFITTLQDTLFLPPPLPPPLRKRRRSSFQVQV